MKRCPTCNRVESDDALKFCRVDGTVLVDDSTVADQYSSTRVLPSGQASAVHTDPGHPTGATGLAQAKPAAVATAGLANRVAVAESPLTRLNKHRAVAIIFVALAITGVVVFSYFYFPRRSTTTLDSIAVLPFVNQNRDPETEYLSDGLTESIINSLTQLPSLRVSPRSTVFQYKGKETDPLKVGSDLGVRAVLTGRLLQRGDSLMVSAELLDVRDQKQIWGEQYNRKLADALAMQQEISREISERLRTKLSGEEQKQLTRRDTSNPEAYQSYLKGRYYWNKRTAENIRNAIEQFQLAADKDPNYALAYVGLADCYGILDTYAGTPATEAVPKAKAFAERALELDGSLAEAHASLGNAYLHLWQWDQAEAESQRSIKLKPDYATAHQWYSLYLRSVGRFDEAMAEIKRAQELDPVSPVIGQDVAWLYLFGGEVNSSIEQSNKVINLNPNFPRAHSTLGLAYLKQRRYGEAIAELQKAVELSPQGDRRVLRDLGYGYAIAGKRAEALAILKDVQRKYDTHAAFAQDVAAIYAGLGEKDQAFAWLEKAFQDRSGQLERIRWEPVFESLRSDPRSADILRRMGLKP